MESGLKMAHEELVKVKNRSFPYFRERTQEQSWNTTFLTRKFAFEVKVIRLHNWLTRTKCKNLLGISRNNDSFLGF